MSYDLFSILYVLLFIASFVVIILLGVVLYRTNKILKSTEKITDAASDGFTKLIEAALNVATVGKGIEKIIEVLENRFSDKKSDKK